jgi:hypothetical protein
MWPNFHCEDKPMRLFLEDMRWYLMGVWECRHDVTTNPGGMFIETYDRGRALGRKLLMMKD